MEPFSFSNYVCFEAPIKTEKQILEDRRELIIDVMARYNSELIEIDNKLDKL